LGYMLVYPRIYENICKKACTLELSKNSNKTRKKKIIFLPKIVKWVLNAIDASNLVFCSI
jgi:hypothetical protein